MEKYRIRKEVKRQIIAGIDKNELVLLTFSRAAINTDLRWEHAREFEYRGEMYDIVETNETGDSISYWCWWDHRETALNKSLDKLTQSACGQSPGSKEKQQRLQDFVRSLICIESDLPHFPQSTPASATHYYIDLCKPVDAHAPPAPPPDLV